MPLRERRRLVWIPDSAVIAFPVLAKRKITGDHVRKHAVKMSKSSSRCEEKPLQAYTLQGTVNLQKPSRNADIFHKLPGPTQQDKEMCAWP